jgi:hypothetical protein
VPAALSERAAAHQAGSVALMGALPQLLGNFASEPEVVSQRPERFWGRGLGTVAAGLAAARHAPHEAHRLC